MKSLIICDIDKCLAVPVNAPEFVEGTIFDHDAFGAAIPNFPLDTTMSSLLEALRDSGRDIVFLTARREDMHRQTREWLSRYGWGSHLLVMRPMWDVSRDPVCKIRQYREVIKPIYGDAGLIIDDKADIIDHFHHLEGVPGIIWRQQHV